MNKKLKTIQTLKSKVYEIQNHLQSITSDDRKPDPQTFIFGTPSPKANLNSTGPTYFRNPTFWGKNPILNKQDKQNASPKAPPKNNRSKQKPRVPLNIQTIINNMEAQYYQSAPQSSKNNHQAYFSQSVKNGNSQISYNLEKEIHQRQRKYFRSRNTSPVIYDKIGQTPRFQKIRTYHQQQSNPILAPNPQKPQGKKIVREISRSPQNPYTNNPNSTPYMYFDRQRRPICLSPNFSRRNQKNNSPSVKNILSSSLQLKDKECRRSKSGKKHYRRYFQETLGYHW